MANHFAFVHVPTKFSKLPTANAYAKDVSSSPRPRLCFCGAAVALFTILALLSYAAFAYQHVPQVNSWKADGNPPGGLVAGILNGQSGTAGKGGAVSSAGVSGTVGTGEQANAGQEGQFKGRIDGEGRSRKTPRQKIDQWLDLPACLETAALPGKIVLLTTFTHAWREMMDLWLERIAMVEDARGVMDHLVVLTFDNTSLAVCREYNFICYFDTKANHSLLTTNKEMLFRSDPYMNLIWRRIEIVREVLTTGYSVMFSDVDVVWVKNPLPFLLGGEEDMAVASEYWNPDPSKVTMNGGFWFMKSNTRTLSFLDYWLEDHNQKYPHMHDQDVFNQIRPETNAHTAATIGIKVRYLPTFRIGTFCEPAKDYRTLVTMHATCMQGHNDKLGSLKKFVQEYDTLMQRKSEEGKGE